MQDGKAAFEEVMDAFFGEESLMQTMIKLMNSMAEHESDALCQIPILLLSEDVEINLTDTGFMPFASTHVMILYTKMNRRQLQSLGLAYDAGSVSNSLLVNSMMRQGVHVHVTNNRYRVDAVRVLVETNNIVCGGVRERVSKGDDQSDFSHAASVIQRRVLDSVVLPKCVLMQAQSKIAACFRK